jgi:hypothetical protein
MWNGWKKAAIGLSALLAFVLLELMAVIGGIAVLLIPQLQTMLVDAPARQNASRPLGSHLAGFRPVFARFRFP